MRSATSTATRLVAATAAVAAAAVGALTVGAPAEAAGPPARPDTACQQAGIATLQSAGLLDDVARDGLPLTTALSLEVTLREGATLDGVPEVLPLPLLLADHRAGEASTFVYPWCE